MSWALLGLSILLALIAANGFDIRGLGNRGGAVVFTACFAAIIAIAWAAAWVHVQ